MYPFFPVFVFFLWLSRIYVVGNINFEDLTVRLHFFNVLNTLEKKKHKTSTTKKKKKKTHTHTHTSKKFVYIVCYLLFNQ